MSACTRKLYRLGTQRGAPVAETVNRVESIAELMGITRVANVTGLDKVGVPVVMVCRPNSRSVSVFQGKGVNLEAAKASGLMEAVETFHAENIDRPLKFVSRNDLQRESAVVQVDDLPMSTGGLFHDERRMLWIEGLDVNNDTSTWLPFDVVHADHSLTSLSSGGCFQVSTKGLASGNSVLEAVNHALCEVIERDATTLWNYLPNAGKLATEIELETVTDGVAVGLIQLCTKPPFALRVWEATSDIGVAVFIAELSETHDGSAGAWNKPAYGSGCHPSKEIGLIRSVTEAAQSRMTFIAGARDDLSWDDYEPDAGASLAERRGTIGQPSRRNFDGVPSCSHDNFSADFDWIVARLTGCGLSQVLIVDLSLPGLGLAVVRAVVPGLEGSDEHYETYVPGVRARNGADALRDP